MRTAPSRNLSKKGAGIHHLALQVESVESVIESLLAANIEMIDEVPRDGAHQTKIARASAVYRGPC